MIVAFLLDFVVKMAGYIDLAAHDWLDYIVAVGVFVGFVVRHLEELPYCVHVAVISYGNCRHTEFPRPCKQLFDVCKAVENGVLGVQV